jgi:RHS repeat-associated protein
VGGVTTNYTYDAADRLLTVNGATVTSDANGNVTAYGTDSYTWDVRGRLQQINRSGATYQFTYGFNDLRISKSVNGTLTSYLLNGDQVVRETTGGVTTDLLQGPFTDRPLQRGGEWFVQNHLGSTAAMTNGSGTVVQSYGYKPFGELTNSPTDSNPFQFTGRENDGTGLLYYRARYYVPEWGRFISEDPSGTAGGINQYVYATNNPLTFGDPSGLWIPTDKAKKVFQFIQTVSRLFNNIWNPEWSGDDIIRVPGNPSQVIVEPWEPPAPSGDLPPAPPEDLETPPVPLPEPPWGPRFPRKPVRLPGQKPGGGFGPPRRFTGGGGGYGSGGAFGVFFTIYEGLDAFAQGADEVVKYRNKVQSYMDPEGDWQP